MCVSSRLGTRPMLEEEGEEEEEKEDREEEGEEDEVDVEEH